MLAPEGLPNIGDLLASCASEPDAYHGFDHEFHVSTVETRTDVCHSLRQVRGELKKLRGTLTDTASEAGLSVLSAGTMPNADWRTTRLVRKPRYDRCFEHYRDVVQRRVTCGCHVHVGIADKELAVQVLNRVQPWLPMFLAVSASSPFYDGADTGYQSFRNPLWAGFPIGGPPPLFDSHAEYAEHVRQLLEIEALTDMGNLYWDARLGTHFPTLEFRIADACTTVDETVLIAGLARALVLTCIDEIQAERPPVPTSPPMIKAATWRAARSGMNGDLIDPMTAEHIPAADMLDRFMHYIQEALKDLGDWEEISHLASQILTTGTSSHRQHRTLTTTGHLPDVIDELITETTRELL
ncbi:putative glutamate--cysteine ligase 2 [Acrocarpospora phusangensis]|uniref:Putative glutamate--cysteine ligase 2 n=2 Tax=Acrocarpospora phusangensis TaxID=1070424 RepID=A0A919Q730_9ACTN|nr:putative glutamate--cysteine ligase 2 [Acrocarpospora phusangensis]